MSDFYFPLRSVHMACAALSILGFVIRWIWMLRESPLLQKRVVQVVPHIVDTLLLLSAIGLVGVIDAQKY